MFGECKLVSDAGQSGSDEILDVFHTCIDETSHSLFLTSSILCIKEALRK